MLHSNARNRQHSSAANIVKSAVCSVLTRHGLHRGASVCVAFSGGSDSTALLLAAAEAGYAVRALHCNFHLRGEESNRDEAFCRDLCRRYGIALEVRHFNVGERQRMAGESVEMAARWLRYEWFAEFAPLPVLTAHHRSDNVETFLLNLMRGSGLRGLRGIPESRGHFLRPLLGVEREMLLRYLEERGETFVTDSTNLETEYRRNRVRHNLLPALTAEFPTAAEMIDRTASNLRRDYALLTHLLSQAAAQFVNAEGDVNVAALASQPVAPEMLYHLLGGELDYATAERIVASATESGRVFEGAGSRRWLLNRGWLTPLTDREAIRQVPTRLIVEELPLEAFTPDRSGNTLWLDGEALATRHLWTLRPWREGDRLHPFGMRGTRLVSDILSDAKVPLPLKAQTQVLTLGDRLLWVVGHRAACHFPVTPTSKSVLRVTVSRD